MVQSEWSSFLNFFLNIWDKLANWCFRPKFDTSSIFHFVAIPLTTQKIKII